MNLRPSRRPLLALAAVVALSGLAACGDDDDSSGTASSTSSQSAASGRPVDAAFVEEMVPHHESAVEMAEIAQQRGRSAFVKGLAADIIKTQDAEISTMRQIKASKLQGVAAGDLGVPSHMMGMDMDLAELRSAAATDFDRVFIDMMVPHHEGAIEMARAELAKGATPELKTLAQDIIGAQQREIAEMKDFREKTFGASAGGDAHSGHGG